MQLGQAGGVASIWTTTECCVSTLPALSTDWNVIVCEPSFEPLDGAGISTEVPCWVGPLSTL